MTATERAKRSDALYYETVSVTRRVLCDMIANREADLEDARAENAKLREQGARLFDKTLELGTENELLRELVRDMWRDGMCECDEFGACAECEYHFTDRMRELGVDA